MQAVTALTGTVGSLIPKLGKLLSDEYKLQKGLKGQVESLQEYLQSAYAVLRDVDACPPDQLDRLAKLWAGDIREAAYDMEDILDTFFVRVEARHSPNHDSFHKLLREKMTKMFNKVKERHKIASEIEKIKNRLQEVKVKHTTFTVDTIVAKPTASSSTPDPRLSALYREEKDLIGIEKSIADVISMFSLSHLGDDRSNKRMIVSVVGAGGLGKTTIAKAVYDKLKQPPFSCGAFVPVGRNPNLKKVLRDILIELDKEKYTDPRYREFDDRQLVDEIRDFLRDKRYFIVIDDLWETKTWKTIELALVENNSGSRIIITTRKLEVSTGKVYNLQPLSDDSSRKLFCKRLFHEDKFPANEPPEVNVASDKILKKCAGVPLAIITMASFLERKPRETWFEVCGNISFIEDEVTMWILSLSFNDLPPHLRTCLLYLSAFPEDYVIAKDLLIWKWVAEGFVNKEQGMGLFEVGEGYFNDLVNRSMIQAVEFNDLDACIYGCRYGCRVHDMVLDLLREVSCKENFFAITDNVVAATSSKSKARRLAIQNISREHSSKDKQLDMSKVRSFMAFSCDIDNCISFRGFKLLRVLAIEHCPPIYQLGHLAELIHLRHIGIICTRIKELPQEIGDLKFLQTLLLKGLSTIEELPSSVGSLTQLVCLRASGTRVRTWVIGRLTCLEELEISIEEDEDSMTMRQFIKDLSNLTHLRVLIIHITTSSIEELDLSQSLEKLQRIQHLYMDFTCAAKITLSGTWSTQVLPRCLRHLSLRGVTLSSLPLCINPLHLVNLSHLALEVDGIDEQALESLSRLPQLRFLSLDTESTVTLANVAADGFFQMLMHCHLSLSMVQFVLNEDSSVTFTLWNGLDDVSFVSRKEENQHRVLPAIMPNLQLLHFFVPADTLVRNGGSCDSLGLEYLRSLDYVGVYLYWLDDRNMAIQEKAALERAIEAHPNHPRHYFLSREEEDDE